MGFFRDRTIHGRRYTYYEERWRENGKVKSRSTIVKTVRSVPVNAETDRKAAVERYRDTLRQNVFIYGKSKPGERYEAEALAREAYQRHLDAEQRGEAFVQLSQEEHFNDVRSQFVHLGKASQADPSSRAEAAFMSLRDAVHAEDRQLDKESVKAGYPAKGSPTEEEEAKASDFIQTRDDYLSEKAEEWAEVQADEASDAPNPDSQGETPDV